MSDEQMNVSIGAKLTGLLAGLKEAQAAVGESVATMSEEFEALNASVASLATPFAALAGLLVGGELFEHIIEDTVSFAVQLDVLSQKTGMETEELSALKYAADLSHVGFEELSTGLDRFARNVYEAQKGSGLAADALHTLGIRTTDAHGRLLPLQDMLLQVADRFHGMEDGAGKTALAMELFGRSGAQLIPFLNQGRDGIAQLEAEAKKLGITMDNDGKEKAIAYEDAIKELDAAMTGMKRSIVEQLLPTLTSLASALTQVAESGSHAKGIFDAIGFVLRHLEGDFIQATAEIEMFWAAMTNRPAVALQKIKELHAQLVQSMNLLKDPSLAADLALVNGPGGSKSGAPGAGGSDGPSAAELRRQEEIADKKVEQKRDEQLRLLEAERDGIKKSQAAGEISAADALALERELEDRIYQVKRDALEEEYRLAKSNAKHQEEIKDQIIRLETEHQSKIGSLTADIVRDIGRQWDGYLQKVTSVFDQVHLVSKNAFANIAFESAKAGLEMFAQHEAHELAKTEVTAEQTAQRVLLETWAALQTVAVNAWAALESIANYAWTAIAATWASISAIPIVGPFLAPAIALGAGAGILALAGNVHSAAGGFDIPSGMNPMTQLHQNEMVLPAELANKIRGMTDGGGGDHYHVTIQAMDAQSFHDFARRNPDGFGTGVAGAIRSNHTGLRKALGKHS